MNTEISNTRENNVEIEGKIKD